MASFEDVWARRMAEAQVQQTMEIQGQVFSRIPFGLAGRLRCPDCQVGPGQLHVSGCDLEVCPRCGGQAFACDCH